MNLPGYVLDCLTRLEQSGQTCYAVGGCVRDWLLGLTPHDYDLCTDAPPEKIRSVFAGFDLVLAGEKHGTVGVITPAGVVEITTFRTEGSYCDNRHPDSVCFVDRVEEDLARRDFTVNAMAWSPKRGLVDPFGGQADLDARILRAVGDPDARFEEDALRILRGIRFAVRFDLQPDERTRRAMDAQSPLLDRLARERVFEEMNGILPRLNALQVLEYRKIFFRVIPELAESDGFDQRSPHHAFDVLTHIAHVVENVPAQPEVRWAALLHDVAKPACFTQDETGRGHFYGHAPRGAEVADGILQRLRAPNHLRNRAVELIRLHMTKLEQTSRCVRRWLSRLGPEALAQLLQLQKADMQSKGVDNSQELEQFAVLQELCARVLQEDACLCVRDLAVSGHDLIALGYAGPEIGKAQERLLDLVIDEKLPNQRRALLEYLQEETL